MHFEIKQLRHFVCVVDTGNITRAAEQQFITQPALTRSIRNMEERVGGLLLNRSSRSTTPTEAGKVLYRYAKLIINQAELAVQDVRAISNGEKGHVHVGIAALFAPSLITHLIPHLSEKFPGLNVRISEGFFEDLVSKLNDGEIDVIVSNFPPDAVPPDVTLKPLFSIRTEFVVGASHPLAGKSKVSTEDLRSANWAIVKQPHIVDFLTRYFAHDSLPPVTVAVEASSLATLKTLVMMGKYVAMLPRRWIVKEIEAGELFVLRRDEGALVREAGLILRKADTQRPAVENVIPVIEEACLSWQADR
ncbi:MAG: LysR family transcriptional regulator [Pseudomonadota bacterium]